MLRDPTTPRPHWDPFQYFFTFFGFVVGKRKLELRTASELFSHKANCDHFIFMRFGSSGPQIEPEMNQNFFEILLINDHHNLLEIFAQYCVYIYIFFIHRGSQKIHRRVHIRKMDHNRLFIFISGQNPFYFWRLRMTGQDFHSLHCCLNREISAVTKMEISLGHISHLWQKKTGQV